MDPDPGGFLKDWADGQRRRDRAQRAESLAFFALLASMLVVMLIYLARFDQRAAELNELLRAQRTAIAATARP